MYSNYPDPMPEFVLSPEGRRLLESALAEPCQTFGGRFLRRTIYDKAGALLRSLIKNHPLIDGNKRVGLTATECFLLVNGHVFDATQEERVKFAIHVAASEPDISVKEVALWVKSHSISQAKLLEKAKTGIVDPRVTRMEQLVGDLMHVLEQLRILT